MKRNNKSSEAPLTKSVKAIINGMKNEGRGEILSDILGSYTGTGANGEPPEQDADDL